MSRGRRTLVREYLQIDLTYDRGTASVTGREGDDGGNVLASPPGSPQPRISGLSL